MKLSVIITKAQYNGLLENDGDLVSKDVYVGTQNTIQKANENGLVDNNEYLLQVTVDQIYETQTNTKLVKVTE